jgi:hypothetical protein
MYSHWLDYRFEGRCGFGLRLSFTKIFCLIITSFFTESHFIYAVLNFHTW